MLNRKDEEYEILAVRNEKVARKRRNKRTVSRGLRWSSWLLFALEVLALSALVIYVGVLSFLPTLYFAILLMGVVLLCSVQFMALRLQKRPAGTSVISLVMSIVMLFSSISGISLLRFVYDNIDKTNQGAHVSTIVLSIYVRKDSNYENFEDLKYGNLGVRTDLVSDTMDRALEQVRLEFQNRINVLEYDDYSQLLAALKEGDIDALLLEQAQVANILEFFDNTFESWAHALDVDLSVQQNIDHNKVNVTKDPFVVYISGVDTRGNSPIGDTGLSDVNQIAVINPSTKKILLINTPRDTYVALMGDSTKMDKLTHAGLYGTNCSIRTLESLYDVDINYYVKMNFYSLVRIIDALGGITVQSEYTFSSDYSLSETMYTFYKGPNYLNGDRALAFARHRKGLPGGDMRRGVHQQQIIQAVLKKLTSATVISNFTGILTAITDNTKTNISSEEINSLIQMQLKDMASWDIQTYAMFGENIMGTLYAISTDAQFDVLSTPEDQVAQIKTMIKEVMRGR